MKYLKRKNISWYFESNNQLINLFEQLSEDKNKRRSYFILENNGKRYFIKYFLEKGLIGTIRNILFPRGKKEYFLGNTLLSFSINTPKPFGYGIGKTGSFVIQEYLKGPTFLSAYKTAIIRDSLIEALARFLAQFHYHHIRHNDLHLENILVIDHVLFIIDLHKTVIRKDQLSSSDEISNLAHGLAMIYPTMTHDQKNRFFQIYGNAEIREYLERVLDSQWYVWIKRKKKRAFCETSLMRKMGKRVYMKGEENKGEGRLIEVIKKGKKVTVEKYGDHIRKTYAHTHKAKRAWQNIVVLNYFNLLVIPRPYFIQVEYPWKPSYIAMEDLSGKGKELDRFLDGEYDFMTIDKRMEMARSLARFFVTLYEKGIIHRDVKACNIFVLSDRFVLLDFEDFLFHRLEEIDLERLIWQLHISIPTRILLRDRMVFFKHLTKGFPFNKRAMFKRLRKSSENAQVVYEGTQGLRIETLKWSRINPP